MRPPVRKLRRGEEAVDALKQGRLARPAPLLAALSNADKDSRQKFLEALRDGIGGEGVPAEDLTRADFEDVTPLILVESPVPGEAVTSPVDR